MVKYYTIKLTLSQLQYYKSHITVNANWQHYRRWKRTDNYIDM